jgi:hypothetical protein
MRILRQMFGMRRLHTTASMRSIGFRSITGISGDTCHMQNCFPLANAAVISTRHGRRFHKGEILHSIFSRLGLRKPAPVAGQESIDRAALGDECADLRARLADSETRLVERSRLLYDLQQRYSSEHFALQKCMRDLKTEAMRNAGAYSSLEITLDRARTLQLRISALKARLRKYEAVEDEQFDAAPIRIEEPRREGG